MQENKIIRESYWCEGTSFLIKKWDRICLQRKHMHNKAANTYDLKNKFLSIGRSKGFISKSTISDNLAMDTNILDKFINRVLNYKNYLTIILVFIILGILLYLL